MTALAMKVEMIQQLPAISAESQMLQPLAIAVSRGIPASMALSLIVTPAVNFFISGK